MEIESKAEWSLLQCDPIGHGHCGLPFPSNVYTVADETTPTGRRLQLSLDMMPSDRDGVRPSPTPWNRSDGFSASAPLMASFPGLTSIGLELSDVPTPLNIPRSMEFDSPTILIDAESGERIPHWVEMGGIGRNDEPRTLLVRPAQRLADGRRYVVALRRLVDDEGVAIEPTEAFLALRDGMQSDDVSVTERRALYENIFNVLEAETVLRYDIQLAWDFTTASRRSTTRPLLAMRDIAQAWVDEAGLRHRITSVDDDWESERIAYRVRGEFQVPLFLDDLGPGGHLVRDEQGLPRPNLETPWAWFPFELIVPRTALDEPGPLLQYGHDLLGDHQEVERESLLQLADDYGYVLLSVDMLGMASEDRSALEAVIDSGRIDDLSSLVDRQHQGIVNTLLATRLGMGLTAEEGFGAAIDGSRTYYYGVGQGGMFGATTMALSADLDRAVLDAAGQPYTLLMPRSVDFDPFAERLRVAYSDPREIWMALGLAQILWDRTEPAGYAHTLLENPLPGAGDHAVLLRAALGDHRVNGLGSQMMARTIGLPQLDTDLSQVPGLEEVWGLSPQPGPIEGSGYVEYYFGLPFDPLEAAPQRECEDPHDQLGVLPEARAQLDAFLERGRVENTCDLHCVFPTIAGC